MRAEEIQKESRLYSGPDAASIHFQCLNNQAQCVITGDAGMLIRSIATLLLQIEKSTGFSRFAILWDIQKLMKDISKHSIIEDRNINE